MCSVYKSVVTIRLVLQCQLSINLSEQLSRISPSILYNRSNFTRSYSLLLTLCRENNYREYPRLLLHSILAYTLYYTSDKKLFSIINTSRENYYREYPPSLISYNSICCLMLHTKIENICRLPWWLLKISVQIVRVVHIRLTFSEGCKLRFVNMVRALVLHFGHVLLDLCTSLIIDTERNVNRQDYLMRGGKNKISDSLVFI